MRSDVSSALSLPRSADVLCLAALTLFVWGSALGGVFQYDDFANIVLEPSTRDLSRATGLRWLTRLSYFVDHAIWGMDPRGFLLTNVLLHLGSVLCVRALSESILTADGGVPWSRVAAFLAAALFAIQPAHAEVVAYASGRATGLMTLLLLAGLVLRARGWKRSGAGALALACLAKEVALVFPLLVWLRERSARELARTGGVALACVSALACVPRYRELAAYSLEARGAVESLLLNASVLPVQLSLWLRPWALSVEHAVDLSPSAAAVGGGFTLVATLVAVAIAARRGAPILSFAIGWTLVSLLPTSSFVARADPLGERALYLAWVGPALALGAALASIRVRAPKAAAGAAIALLVAMAAAASTRARVWSDERALWADAVEKAPASARAWNNLGMAHLTHEEYEQASEAFRRALAIDPSSPRALENLRELRLQCGKRCP